METEKLYYQDCHCYAFSARVLDCRRADGGFDVILDRTAFFPEGGGQASDRGTLGGVNVLDVQEKNGEILHRCDGPLPIGTDVEGKLDVARRQDLAQQHAGEHIVSGLLHKRFGYENVGFHVGAELMEVDFSGPLTDADIAWVEAEANRVVRENQKIRCWYPSEAELPGISYRTKRALPWPVRIVEIGGVDRCACCGVHVGFTGEIGLIKIVSCVKFKGGSRLEMCCGGRAYRYCAEIFEQNRKISRLLSAKPMETAEAVEQLKGAMEAEKFRANDLQRQLFRILAEQFAGQDPALCRTAGLSGGDVRLLCQEVQKESGGLAAVFSEQGNTWNFCLMGDEDRVQKWGERLRKDLNARCGGRGNAIQGTLSAGGDILEPFFTSFTKNSQ